MGEREKTPELLEGMDAEIKFKNLSDLSDSEEANMELESNDDKE